jgi:hypothetical protein
LFKGDYVRRCEDAASELYEDVKVRVSQRLLRVRDCNPGGKVFAVERLQLFANPEETAFNGEANIIAKSDAVRIRPQSEALQDIGARQISDYKESLVCTVQVSGMENSSRFCLYQ